MSDIEIAQKAKMKRIVDLAKEQYGIESEHLDPYGCRWCGKAAKQSRSCCWGYFSTGQVMWVRSEQIVRGSISSDQLLVIPLLMIEL